MPFFLERDEAEREPPLRRPWDGVRNVHARSSAWGGGRGGRHCDLPILRRGAPYRSVEVARPHFRTRETVVESPDQPGSSGATSSRRPRRRCAPPSLGFPCGR